MIFSNFNDINRCKEIVMKEFIRRNITVNDDMLNKITEDIMNISYSKGGDYSDEIIHCFAETYIEEEFYKKYLENK